MCNLTVVRVVLSEFVVVFHIRFALFVNSIELSMVAQVVEVQNAVQVVDFVFHRLREQAVGVHLNLFSV